MSRKKSLIGWLFVAAALFTSLIAIIMILARHSRQKYALFNAARYGDLQTVQHLVQQGAPINLQVASSFGWTPLIGAIYDDRTNNIRYLVEAGADVNLPDREGRTPLMWLVVYNDAAAPMISFLIAHGANVDARDKNGLTALDYARSDPPKPQIIKLLEAAKAEQSRKRHRSQIPTNNNSNAAGRVE